MRRKNVIHKMCFSIIIIVEHKIQFDYKDTDMLFTTGGLLL